MILTKRALRCAFILSVSFFVRLGTYYPPRANLPRLRRMAALTFRRLVMESPAAEGFPGFTDHAFKGENMAKMSSFEYTVLRESFKNNFRLS